MNRKTFFPFGLIGIAGALMVLSQPDCAKAQSLSGIRVGDTPSKLSQFGPVSGEDKYKGLDLFKWVFHNGNSLMATVDAEGEIVYLESDWGGRNDDAGCDLPGLKFGVTTLAELSKRFGSNGFGFKGRPHIRKTDDGEMLLNSYEVGNVVVTFYSRINGKDLARLQAENAGGAGSASSAGSGAEDAKLEGISLANAAYAKSEWGVRIPNPAYKKVEWK